MSGIRFIPSQSGVGSRVGIGLSAVVGPTGPRGPTGASGLQGPAGVASLTGATGYQGFQGLVGATGPSNPGVQGYQGLVGATGPSNPGVQGFQGFVGATGDIGLQGLVGATGAIGLQGLQGGAGMGFVVFANTTSYTGLNTVQATGGNIGQFVLVLGGDLFVYAGTGAGYTGPGNSYGYAGDVTDESKLVGLQGVQGSIGPQGSQYTGPFTDLTVSGTSYLNNVVASGNMSGSNGFFQNLAAQNFAAQGVSAGFGGLLVVGGTTLIGALQATGGINAPSATINNLVVTGSITLPTGASAGPQGLIGLQGPQGLIGLQGPQGLIGLQGSQYTGPFTQLTVSGDSSLNTVTVSGYMTGTSASFSFLKVTDLVVGGETGGSLYINTGVVSNLTVMNQIITGQLILSSGATIGSAGDTLFTDASFNVANIFTVNAYNGDVISTGALTASSGSFGKINVDRELHLATGAIVTGDLTLSTGSSIGSAGDTLFTDASFNVANIFTVNAYNGDVISTGALTASSGSFGKIKATTATVTGTTYLNDTVSSGNMSGTNAYFLNLAGQNLAAQGASLGFNGLLVVGGTTLIGTLNATGGINSQGITTTTATINNNLILQYTGTTSTGSIASNTLRGNCIIDSSVTSLTVNNTLVTPTSSVFAVASTQDTTGYVTSVVPGTNQFTINCIAPAAPMNINWLVIN